MRIASLFSFVLIVLLACTGRPAVNRDKVIAEIKIAEKNFETMAAKKGIQEAFYYYADANAVIKRTNDTLIYGKEAIRNYYADIHYEKATVRWSPDFIDAAVSGDMAYTYGKYTWLVQDSGGHFTEVSKGVFHTVWKRQEDGSWKYVWD